MELTYHWEGDYLIPDLTIGEEKEPIGKYGISARFRFPDASFVISYVSDR